MSFDQDPGEQANISGSDFAILCDELKELREQRYVLVAALKRCSAVCAGESLSKSELIGALEAAQAALTAVEETKS